MARDSTHHSFRGHHLYVDPGILLSPAAPDASRWLMAALTASCSRELLCASMCRRGVLIAGVAFGLLHNNGGRNWAFAAWASLVGVVYGAAFLHTEVRAPLLKCAGDAMDLQPAAPFGFGPATELAPD